MKIGHHKSFKKELKNLEEVKQWFAKSGDKDIGEFLLQLLHHYIGWFTSHIGVEQLSKTYILNFSISSLHFYSYFLFSIP